MSDLYHECPHRPNGLVKLRQSVHKTPYSGPVDEYGMRVVEKPRPVSHFENWLCDICNLHVMRLVESHPNLRVTPGEVLKRD